MRSSSYLIFQVVVNQFNDIQNGGTKQFEMISWFVKIMKNIEAYNFNMLKLEQWI
jgi:hypothetical protein